MDVLIIARLGFGAFFSRFPLTIDSQAVLDRMVACTWQKKVSRPLFALEEICFKRLSMYVLDTFYLLRFPTPGVEFLHEKNINRMLVESHVKPISPRVDHLLSCLMSKADFC